MTPTNLIATGAAILAVMAIFLVLIVCSNQSPRGRGHSLPLSSLIEFQTLFNLARRPMPELPDDDGLHQLRIDTMQEELDEFREAIDQHDLVGVADALADLAYFVYGTAVCYGIDLDAVLAEVHRSNLTKIGPDGQIILREDGKVLKPETYEAPQLAGVLTAQRPLY